MKRIVAAVGLTFFLWDVDSASAAERPNIVVLLVDDLGYAELGCQGGVDVVTPRVDALAAQGVRFTQGYVSAPYCSPSRAGLLSGRLQTRFGYEFNPVGAQNFDERVGLPRRAPNLATRLRDAGYATALIGKWHLGATPASNPLRHGFDEFFGFLHEGRYYAPVAEFDGVTWLRRRRTPGGGQGRWVSPDGRIVHSRHMNAVEPPYDADNPLLRGGSPTTENEYLTDVIARESADFIRRHRDRPFFLLTAFNAVHSPMQARREDLERFSHIPDLHRRIFLAMLFRLDQATGVVLDELDRHGLTRNTLIFFLSDHGGPTRELTSSNLPLRGGKGDLYEGGVRVPFLARWPAAWPQGVVEERPVVSFDVAATALAAADAAPIEGNGVDLTPFLDGRRSDRPHDAFYWRLGAKAALRQGDWKLVRNGHGPTPSDWELYDLAADPAERRDRIDDAEAPRDELLQVFEELDSEMAPPAWRP